MVTTNNVTKTDLLEFGDIFEVEIIKNKVQKLKKSANNELKIIDKFGDLVEAIENGYMKSQLVKSQTQRQKNIESSIQKVVGVNCLKELSPLVNSTDGGFMKVDEKTEKRQINNVEKWKSKRNDKKVQKLQINKN